METEQVQHLYPHTSQEHGRSTVGNVSNADLVAARQMCVRSNRGLLSYWRTWCADAPAPHLLDIEDG